ncbi:NAD-dependent succinate-semialdehyde dehydrogenase [Gordonia westfalica]|uniref:Succinate semialdehyde dehydrogenase n=1 Tax=Gordonia westfalica TaxID=158898 RepID=A0A1H2KWK3_9ACTN|nr:NAD-dependent succinate-semialdehyde dehydrogenase [Gordonia westfalica]SDU72808.1 succinate semialdehyde dehydrogenase [Gordonia westfalica]
MHLRTFTVENPATLTSVAEVPDMGPAEAREAVRRAHHVLDSWASRAPRDRSDILMRAHRMMIEDADSLADLVSQENGKSMSDAHAEIRYAAEFFRWYAEEAVRSEGTFGVANSGGSRNIVTHRPVGVAALVTPWNFPAAMVTRKVAPALAAGCSVVLKPAAETPLTAMAIADLLTRADLPDGVLTTVTTTDPGPVVDTWLGDERVRKLSFTGSTRVGRLLLHAAADRIINCSMELGGNAPVIITEDADLEQAVAGTMIAKFRNGGQACTAANRILVHRTVADDYVALLAARVGDLAVGDPRRGSAIGPMISARERDRLVTQVDTAVAGGARVVRQAPLPDLPGHFVAPTVLTDVAPGSPILNEELFGPVAPVVTWQDDDEVIALANATEHGLAAYVFAGDTLRAMALAERIQAGMVGINRGVVSDPAAPFGGFKQSGLGREGARDGLRAFQETQYLSVDWPF